MSQALENVDREKAKHMYSYEGKVRKIPQNRRDSKKDTTIHPFPVVFYETYGGVCDGEESNLELFIQTAAWPQV